jgi:hypothetical protein
LSSAASSANSADGPGALALERRRDAFDGKLRGRPDVVRQSNSHCVIEDYKTGSLFEAGSDEIKASYRLQLLLYAALEEAGGGKRVASARLIPLDGDPETIHLEDGEALAAARSAVAALDEYNRDVDRGVAPIVLAEPSPDHCRFCPYAVRCPAFWEASTSSWADEGIIAIAGELTWRETSRFDTFDLRCDVTAGTVTHGAVQVHGLDLDRFSPALHAAIGSRITSTGLGGSDGLLRPSQRTRLIVTTPAPSTS